jgi:hypothetical protein
MVATATLYGSTVPSRQRHALIGRRLGVPPGQPGRRSAGLEKATSKATIFHEISKFARFVVERQRRAEDESRNGWLRMGQSRNVVWIQ